MKKYALFLQTEFSTHDSSSKLEPKLVNREIDRLFFFISPNLPPFPYTYSSYSYLESTEKCAL